MPKELQMGVTCFYQVKARNCLTEEDAVALSLVSHRHGLVNPMTAQHHHGLLTLPTIHPHLGETWFCPNNFGK